MEAITCGPAEALHHTIVSGNRSDRLDHVIVRATTGSSGVLSER
jgi:hypothetical protein